MQINVKYSTSLRTITGKAEEQMDLEDNLTVSQLWQKVSGEQEKEGANKILTSVNNEFVNYDFLIKDNDTVSFYPPCQGG